MPGIYYAAVEDDPLTSGKGGRVLASKPAGTITGEDGTRRRLAFIGDEAYCSACDSFGVITYGAGISEHRRLIDNVHGGRRQAVGGDIVLCKCASNPRIIATYGIKWGITDRGDADMPAPITKTPAQSLTYDQQFILTDGGGNPLADTYYTVRLPSGSLIHGITDSFGRTERHVANGVQTIAIYFGHRESI